MEILAHDLTKTREKDQKNTIPIKIIYKHFIQFVFLPVNGLM